MKGWPGREMITVASRTHPTVRATQAHAMSARPRESIVLAPPIPPPLPTRLFQTPWLTEVTTIEPDLRRMSAQLKRTTPELRTYRGTWASGRWNGWAAAPSICGRRHGPSMGRKPGPDHSHPRGFLPEAPDREDRHAER